MPSKSCKKVRDRRAVPAHIARNIDVRLAYIEERTYRQRLNTRVSFGLTSQSNVNSGPEDRQIDIFGLPFTLSNSEMPQSDIIARTAVDFDYRLRLGQSDSFLNAQLTYVAANYAEFDTLNRQDLGIRLGFLIPFEGFPLPRSHFQIHASASQAWIDGSHYMDSSAVTASLSAAPTQKTQIRLSASYQQDDYILSSSRPVADTRDSDKTTLSFTTYYAPGDGWRLMGGFETATLDAKTAYNSWSGTTMRAGVSKAYTSPIKALPGNWTTAFSAEYTQRSYDAPERAFGTEAQSTDITRISLVQSVPLSAAMEAKFSLTSTKADSTYDIYSWSDRSAALTVVYKF